MKKMEEIYFCDSCNNTIDSDNNQKIKNLDICNRCFNDIIYNLFIDESFILRKDCPKCKRTGRTKEYYGHENGDYNLIRCSYCLKFTKRNQ